jgi:acetyl esterase
MPLMPLHPQAQILLDLAATVGLPPIETLTPVEARDLFDQRTADLDAEPDVGEVFDRTVPGPAGKIPIRVYRPVEAADDTPCLLFFHGGGWVIGTVDTHDLVCRALTEATVATVVSVDYRLAPEHPFPAGIDDCEAVTRWVADNGAEIGVNGDRLAVCGDSAGGNLAAAVSLSCADGPNISAQALVYPAVDLSNNERTSLERNALGYLLEIEGLRWFIDHYAPSPEMRLDPRCSPILGDLAGQPPAIVLTAEYDPLLDEGKDYAKALIDAGVPVEYTLFDGQVHTFFTQVGFLDASLESVGMISRFFEKHL